MLAGEGSWALFGSHFPFPARERSPTALVIEHDIPARWARPQGVRLVFYGKSINALPGARRIEPVTTTSFESKTRSEIVRTARGTAARPFDSLVDSRTPSLNCVYRTRGFSVLTCGAVVPANIQPKPATKPTRRNRVLILVAVGSRLARMSARKWRIAVGGIHIESSTFSPHVAGQRDFSVTRRDSLLARYDWMPTGVDWVPLVHARALPGGAVAPEFYDAIVEEFLRGLAVAHAESPLDGVYLDIHGAMSVVGRRDAEGDFASRVREVVGSKVLVSASMDPHGNVSRALASNVDLLTSHRMSPHEDAPLTKRRAMSNLVACLDSRVRPLRAWVTVPVLLPGEKACTRDEPAKSVYASLVDVEAHDDVIDAAVWIGYAWADEPRCQAAVVVTGTDAESIAEHARSLARRWWDERAAFAFSTAAMDIDAALDAALTSTARPFFISDSGDNPTAGGSGDVAYGLSRLLVDERFASGERTAIWASVVAPDAVSACLSAGVGGRVDVTVGGELGWTATPPVRLTGEVTAFASADETGGDMAVIRSGGVHAIVTQRRKPFHYVSELTALGLDPAAVDATIVKIGYLVPDLFDAAKDWVLALTPGGVDQDIERLGHSSVIRPMYPLDAEMGTPTMDVTLFEPGDS